jgi:hypothetical protein
MPFLTYTNEDGVISKIEWTPLSNTVESPKKFLKKKIPLTLGEEVEAGLKEWYFALGKSVPPEELQICKDMDLVVETVVEVKPPKPVYGTPEFWKDWWAKKKAKEAEGVTASAKVKNPPRGS